MNQGEALETTRHITPLRIKSGSRERGGDVGRSSSENRHKFSHEKDEPIEQPKYYKNLRDKRQVSTGGSTLESQPYLMRTQRYSMGPQSSLQRTYQSSTHPLTSKFTKEDASELMNLMQTQLQQIIDLQMQTALQDVKNSLFEQQFGFERQICALISKFTHDIDQNGNGRKLVSEQSQQKINTDDFVKKQDLKEFHEKLVNVGRQIEMNQESNNDRMINQQQQIDLLQDELRTLNETQQDINKSINNQFTLLNTTLRRNEDKLIQIETQTDQNQLKQDQIKTNQDLLQRNIDQKLYAMSNSLNELGEQIRGVHNAHSQEANATREKFRKNEDRMNQIGSQNGNNTGIEEEKFRQLDDRIKNIERQNPMKEIMKKVGEVEKDNQEMNQKNNSLLEKIDQNIKDIKNQQSETDRNYQTLMSKQSKNEEEIKDVKNEYIRDNELLNNRVKKVEDQMNTHNHIHQRLRELQDQITNLDQDKNLNDLLQRIVKLEKAHNELDKRNAKENAQNYEKLQEIEEIISTMTPSQQNQDLDKKLTTLQNRVIQNEKAADEALADMDAKLKRQGEGVEKEQKKINREVEQIKAEIIKINEKNTHFNTIINQISSNYDEQIRKINEDIKTILDEFYQDQARQDKLIDELKDSLDSTNEQVQNINDQLSQQVSSNDMLDHTSASQLNQLAHSLHKLEKVQKEQGEKVEEIESKNEERHNESTQQSQEIERKIKLINEKLHNNQHIVSQKFDDISDLQRQAEEKLHQLETTRKKEDKLMKGTLDQLQLKTKQHDILQSQMSDEINKLKLHEQEQDQRLDNLETSYSAIEQRIDNVENNLSESNVTMNSNIRNLATQIMGEIEQLEDQLIKALQHDTLNITKRKYIEPLNNKIAVLHALIQQLQDRMHLEITYDEPQQEEEKEQDQEYQVLLREMRKRRTWYLRKTPQDYVIEDIMTNNNCSQKQAEQMFIDQLEKDHLIRSRSQSPAGPGQKQPNQHMKGINENIIHISVSPPKKGHSESESNKQSQSEEDEMRQVSDEKMRRPMHHGKKKFVEIDTESAQKLSPNRPKYIVIKSPLHEEILQQKVMVEAPSSRAAAPMKQRNLNETMGEESNIDVDELDDGNNQQLSKNFSRLNDTQNKSKLSGQESQANLRNLSRSKESAGSFQVQQYQQQQQPVEINLTNANKLQANNIWINEESKVPLQTESEREQVYNEYYQKPSQQQQQFNSKPVSTSKQPEKFFIMEDNNYYSGQQLKEPLTQDQSPEIPNPFVKSHQYKEAQPSSSDRKKPRAQLQEVEENWGSGDNDAVDIDLLKPSTYKQMSEESNKGRKYSEQVTTQPNKQFVFDYQDSQEKKESPLRIENKQNQLFDWGVDGNDPQHLDQEFEGSYIYDYNEDIIRPSQPENISSIQFSHDPNDNYSRFANIEEDHSQHM